MMYTFPKLVGTVYIQSSSVDGFCITKRLDTFVDLEYLAIVCSYFSKIGSGLFVLVMETTFD